MKELNFSRSFSVSVVWVVGTVVIFRIFHHLVQPGHQLVRMAAG